MEMSRMVANDFHWIYGIVEMVVHGVMVKFMFFLSWW